MVEIKNVAVVGAAGDIGAPALSAILNSGKFNVTVVARPTSKSTYPASVKVVRADYTSLEALTSAFHGQDAVLSTVGTEGLLGQTLIIDAAIAAGVKRFIPSEFGCNLANPLAAKLPVFGYKIAVRKHLEEKVNAGAAITYTYIINGPFLDWGIEKGFLLGWQEGKPRIFDGGDQLFSSTTLESVALAVVGVLSHYEETKNTSVFVQDTVTSQNQLLELAKKAVPQKKWTPVPTSLAEVEKTANASLAKGDYSVLVQYLFIGIFGEGYGAKLEKLDNKLLGVPGKSEADIIAIWKKVLGDGK